MRFTDADRLKVIAEHEAAPGRACDFVAGTDGAGLLTDARRERLH